MEAKVLGVYRCPMINENELWVQRRKGTDMRPRPSLVLTRPSGHGAKDIPGFPGGLLQRHPDTRLPDSLNLLHLKCAKRCPHLIWGKRH